MTFSTVANLVYSEKTEPQLLGITPRQCDSYLMDKEIYSLRMTGKLKDKMEIAQRIAEKLPFPVAEGTAEKLLSIRSERMKNAICSADDKVIETLEILKRKGFLLSVISNADATNQKYRDISPLKNYFDTVIFSCDVGVIKPHTEIYRLGMSSLGVQPAMSIFVGDGASDELYGAKQSDMTTILTEYFTIKPPAVRREIIKYADYSVTDFSDIINIAQNI